MSDDYQPGGRLHVPEPDTIELPAAQVQELKEQTWNVAERMRKAEQARDRLSRELDVALAATKDYEDRLGFAEAAVYKSKLATAVKALDEIAVGHPHDDERTEEKVDTARRALEAITKGNDNDA